MDLGERTHMWRAGARGWGWAVLMEKAAMVSTARSSPAASVGVAAQGAAGRNDENQDDEEHQKIFPVEQSYGTILCASRKHASDV